MERACIAIFVATVAVVALSVSCDLFSDGTVYFYTMAPEIDPTTSTYRLRYRSDGWTIMMTLGEVDDEGFKTAAEAQSYIEETTFTLTVDGQPIEPEGDKGVEQLTGTLWHVVEAYHVTLDSGEHKVFGTTTVDAKGFFAKTRSSSPSIDLITIYSLNSRYLPLPEEVVQSY